MTVEVKGKEEVISIDCLKPAYLELPLATPVTNKQPIPDTTSTSTIAAPPPSRYKMLTRSG